MERQSTPTAVRVYIYTYAPNTYLLNIDASLIQFERVADIKECDIVLLDNHFVPPVKLFENSRECRVSSEWKITSDQSIKYMMKTLKSAFALNKKIVVTGSAHWLTSYLMGFELRASTDRTYDGARARLYLSNENVEFNFTDLNGGESASLQSFQRVEKVGIYGNPSSDECELINESSNVGVLSFRTPNIISTSVKLNNMSELILDMLNEKPIVKKIYKSFDPFKVPKFKKPTAEKEVSTMSYEAYLAMNGKIINTIKETEKSLADIKSTPLTYQQTGFIVTSSDEETYHKIIPTPINDTNSIKTDTVRNTDKDDIDEPEEEPNAGMRPGGIRAEQEKGS